MLKHFKYLGYVLRHKWFVFLACCKLGIPLRGITHDLSKFRPSEWFPYADFFYGSKKMGKAFDKAWLLHQTRNKHHWEYWCSPDKRTTRKMPQNIALEMIADWFGAGKAQGTAKTWYDIWLWYEVNKMKMFLHPNTRKEVMNRLLSIWID